MIADLEELVELKKIHGNVRIVEGDKNEIIGAKGKNIVGGCETRDYKENARNNR